MSSSSSIEISPYIRAGSPPLSLTERVRALFAGAAGGMWDMTDIAALSQDAAGTVPVAAYGDPIGRVADLSGNGNHLVQATAGARPAWSADGALPDGVDDNLAVGSLDLSACDKVVVAMGYIKVDDADRVQMEFGYSTYGPGTFQMFSGSNYGLHHWALTHGDAPNSVSQAASMASPASNGYGAHISRHSIPDDLSEVWWQGAKGVDGIGDQGAGTFSSEPLFVFARASAIYHSNTPARRALVVGIPAGQPPMPDAGIELIRLWLMEGV